MDTAKCRKKALFVDRDGVIVIEDQIDSYERIIYKPHVFEALRAISRETDYELVMVSNQDGVGTPSFPYESFAGPMERILETLAGEDIAFDDINVDYSLPEDGCPGRKPGIAMLSDYLDGSYDLASSFMIGDRLTDMELAGNLGAKGIWYTDKKMEIPEEYSSVIALNATNWLDIAAFLACKGIETHRTAEISRDTRETKIRLKADLDGTGKGRIETGIGFFDHMLDQVVKHSRCDISGTVDGDLFVDFHHTVEDTALVLGEAVLSALGEKRGVERYGSAVVTMDDTVALAAIDFSGRPEFMGSFRFDYDYIGDFPTELIRHFFRSFSSAARCNLYLEATEGGDSHHTAEALFKAFARALRKAVRRIPGETGISSTKGVL